MPVLDGNIDDGLSDARSLAASMRGGSEDGPQTREADQQLDLNRMGSIRRTSVLLQVFVIFHINCERPHLKSGVMDQDDLCPDPDPAIETAESWPN
jgi:hypothetical protein